ncbi:MAG TPA: hypothetical protein VLA52_10955 [Thermohalobaculum sp.]|nr:hypothetical protein [Thermohalobaculum sp.]
MRKIAIAAVAAALTCSVVAPAFAAGLTSRVVTIDDAKRTLVLADKTVMIIGKDVELGAVKPGMTVAITANMDEDGYSPATAITPVN